MFPPLFNRYDAGMAFGAHVDNAVRQIPGTPFRVRTDLSVTLFLTRPEEYDGGELVVEDVYGAHAVKLPAGDLILYPATSLHRVNPVTRGSRWSSFFWIQSMVRDDGERGAAVRPRHGDQPGQPRRARPPFRGRADELLPQPAPALGRRGVSPG